MYACVCLLPLPSSLSPPPPSSLSLSLSLTQHTHIGRGAGAGRDRDRDKLSRHAPHDPWPWVHNGVSTLNGNWVSTPNSNWIAAFNRKPPGQRCNRMGSPLPKQKWGLNPKNGNHRGQRHSGQAAEATFVDPSCNCRNPEARMRLQRLNGKSCLRNFLAQGNLLSQATVFNPSALGHVRPIVR